MKMKNIYNFSMVAFFLSSISAFLIAMIDRQQDLLISNALAVMFWFTLILGTAFCVILAKKTKPQNKTVPRLLNFFKGKALIIIDTMLIASVVCSVIISVCHINITLLWAALLFLDSASFEFHVLFSLINKEDFIK
jgi:hypothetical protein